MINNKHIKRGAEMEKSESKKRITELVERIVKEDSRIADLKAAKKFDKNGWVDEYAQRCLWIDKEEVNTLAGINLYK
jgi:hypothetical protein